MMQLIAPRRIVPAIRSRWRHGAATRELMARAILPWHSPRPIVTVFGSCRQDSLSKVFPVTPIRDGLTYPHYSKEVLQAIQYVSSSQGHAPLTLEAFRNPQIGERLIDRRQLVRHFRATDVFVVEIASRQVYEVNGDFWHHHVFDSGVAKPETVLALSRRRQADEEVVTDLGEVVRLLSPRPVILVTHLVTRPTGERAELRDLIVHFGSAANVTVIDPIQEFDGEVVGFVEPERVLAHLTDLGHERMASAFQREVNRAFPARA